MTLLLQTPRGLHDRSIHMKGGSRPQCDPLTRLDWRWAGRRACGPAGAIAALEC